MIWMPLSGPKKSLASNVKALSGSAQLHINGKILH
jgi:hypothetical protein